MLRAYGSQALGVWLVAAASGGALYWTHLAYGSLTRAVDLEIAAQEAEAAAIPLAERTRLTSEYYEERVRRLTVAMEIANSARLDRDGLLAIEGLISGAVLFGWVWVTSSSHGRLIE